MEINGYLRVSSAWCGFEPPHSSHGQEGLEAGKGGATAAWADLGITGDTLSSGLMTFRENISSCGQHLASSDGCLL